MEFRESKRGSKTREEADSIKVTLSQVVAVEGKVIDRFKVYFGGSKH